MINDATANLTEAKLDSHWWKASRDRFGLGLQRRLWESPEINRNYSKFADRVGWRVQGRWQKPSSQPLEAREAKTYPLGYFPWHSWQVQGPTPQDPGRFRRVGFGHTP